ncbi:MAG TPA: DUF1684 domain-containing protein [Candidatus Acidoferrum sp.]|nr:DUF1684 domain-containing protein [Candidatus Acidoferrum sp.]
MATQGFRSSIALTLAGFGIASALAVLAAPPAPSGDDLARERQELVQWKQDRVTALTSETGWTTLAGLFWLKNGDNTFGRDKTNALHLDNPAIAAKAGVFRVQDGKVSFIAEKAAGITSDGKPVHELALKTDAVDDYTQLHSSSLTFFAIERAGKLGVRVRDSESPSRKNFKGLDYFPGDDSFVFNARFEPYQNKKVAITNILGMTEDMVAPGALVFSKDGKEYRLDTVLEEPGATELFVMFSDATSGKETYGAARYMYVAMPKDGVIRVNFNKAYNPPCAFTEFATCPLPPLQNRLTTLRVTAGEKTYAGHH